MGARTQVWIDNPPNAVHSSKSINPKPSDFLWLSANLLNIPKDILLATGSSLEISPLEPLKVSRISL